MGLVAIITGFLAGFLSSYFAQWPPSPKTVWNQYRSRRLRERKCYSLPAGKIFLIPSSSSTEESVYVSQNAMAGVHAVTQMLRHCGRHDDADFEIVFQYPDLDGVPENIRTENLILVCGPVRNKLVDSILEEFPELLTSIRFEAAPEPSFIFKGIRYNYQKGRDWALVAVKRNPYNPRRRVVLLFGLRSIGTKGAGAFYSQPGWAEARAKAAERLETHHGELEVLLRVDHLADFRTLKTINPVFG